MPTLYASSARPGTVSPALVVVPPISRRERTGAVLLAAKWLRQGVYLTPAVAYAHALGADPEDFDFTLNLISTPEADYCPVKRS